MEISCCGILPNPSQQCSKHQTRGEDIEKSLNEGLEPTYYSSIFKPNHTSHTWKLLAEKYSLLAFLNTPSDDRIL